MGSQSARDFAGQVADGNIELAGAVSWHLTSNHFPPLPTFFVPVAIAAIHAAQDGEWDEELNLPLGCVEHTVVITEDENEAEHRDCPKDNVVQWRDREDGKVRVSDVIESFHLDSFL